jgi:predicted metal-dependent peptidase
MTPTTLTEGELLMAQARTTLLLDTKPAAAFLATCAMQLRIVPNPDIETMRTDATVLEFNPTWIASLPREQLVTVVAHEVWHCALLHPYRRGSRDLHGWNVACDHRVNHDLIAWGYELPPGMLCDPQFQDPAIWGADAIYAKLASEQPPPPPAQPATSDQGSDDGPDGPTDDSADTSDGDQDSGQDGPAASMPGSMPGCPSGEFVDGSEVPEAKTEEDWKIVAEQAASVARMAGTLPGDAELALKHARQSKLDWRAILREFIVQAAPTDYSWTSPNRRYVAGGLYLPGPIKESVGEIVVFSDTSGSCAGLAADFAAELTAIVSEVRPERVHVVYVDTRVQGTAEFEPDDLVVIEPRGGGGTTFQPAFDWTEEQQIQPRVAIYLTDLESSDTPREPDYPVLWATPAWVTDAPPFGQAVQIDPHV